MSLNVEEAEWLDTPKQCARISLSGGGTGTFTTVATVEDVRLLHLESGRLLRELKAKADAGVGSAAATRAQEGRREL